MNEIDHYIARRNALQLRAEIIGEPIATECWIRMGVTNRHITRVLEQKLNFSDALEREIVRNLEDVEKWLKEKEDDIVS